MLRSLHPCACPRGACAEAVGLETFLFRVGLMKSRVGPGSVPGSPGRSRVSGRRRGVLVLGFRGRRFVAKFSGLKVVGRFVPVSLGAGPSPRLVTQGPWGGCGFQR